MDSDALPPSEGSNAGEPPAIQAPMVAAAPAPRPRGNFWEVTFQARLEHSFLDWVLTPQALQRETGKTRVQVKTSFSAGTPAGTNQPTRAVNLADKVFDTCDVNHFDLKDSSFKGCSFVNCRFIKANFEGVKFSGCRFVGCHFLNVHFLRWPVHRVHVRKHLRVWRATLLPRDKSLRAEAR